MMHNKKKPFRESMEDHYVVLVSSTALINAFSELAPHSIKVLSRNENPTQATILMGESCEWPPNFSLFNILITELLFLSFQSLNLFKLKRRPSLDGKINPKHERCFKYPLKLMWTHFKLIIFQYIFLFLISNIFTVDLYIKLPIVNNYL